MRTGPRSGLVKRTSRLPLRGPVRIGWDESRNLQFQPSGGRAQDLSEVASVREVAA